MTVEQDQKIARRSLLKRFAGLAVGALLTQRLRNRDGRRGRKRIETKRSVDPTRDEAIRRRDTRYVNSSRS